MIALLLCVAFGCWHWDAVPDADGYAVYWSADPRVWWDCQRAEVYGTLCFRDDLAAPVIPNPPPGGLLFVVVTAFNEAGESSTGHGPVQRCAA